MSGTPASGIPEESTERELLADAARALHSFAMAALAVKPWLDKPYTDMPELSPWTNTIGAQARRAHDLARGIRKRLSLPYNLHADRALGTPPLEEADVEAVAAERASWRSVLAGHYLMGINCDHDTRRDNPMCGCCLINLGWHPSVGEAVQAWIEHVTEVIRQEPGND